MKTVLTDIHGNTAEVTAPVVSANTKVAEVDFALNIKRVAGQWMQQVSCGWLHIAGPGDIREDPCFHEGV